jgi:hypothetical protein
MDTVTTARQEWLERQQQRVRVWRRMRLCLHGLAVALLIGGLGTTWHMFTPQPVEQIALDRVLAEVRRDAHFRGLPAVEQRKVIDDLVTGRWVPPAETLFSTGTHLSWASEQYAQAKHWRLVGIVAVPVVIAGLWACAMVALAIAHSIARWMDRYPSEVR